jgi:hypothetical protein
MNSGFIHPPHRSRRHPCFEEEGQRSHDLQVHSHQRRVRLQSGHQPVRGKQRIESSVSDKS